MKSEIEKGVSQPVYPYLATNCSGDIIILLSSRYCGTVVHTSSDSYELGYHSESWIEPAFKPYIGKVTLSN